MQVFWGYSKPKQPLQPVAPEGLVLWHLLCGQCGHCGRYLIKELKKYYTYIFLLLY